MSLESSMSFGISREFHNSEENRTVPVQQSSYAPTPGQSYTQTSIPIIPNEEGESALLGADQGNQAFLAIQKMEYANNTRENSSGLQSSQNFMSLNSGGLNVFCSSLGSQLDFSKGSLFSGTSIGLEPDPSFFEQRSTGLSKEESILKQDSHGISRDQGIPQVPFGSEEGQDLFQQGSIGIERSGLSRQDEFLMMNAGQDFANKKLSDAKDDSSNVEMRKELEKVTAHEPEIGQIRKPFETKMESGELLPQELSRKEISQSVPQPEISGQYQGNDYGYIKPLPSITENISAIQENGAQNLFYKNEPLLSQSSIQQTSFAPDYQPAQQQFSRIELANQEIQYQPSIQLQPPLLQQFQNVTFPQQINPIGFVDCPSLAILSQPQKRIVKQVSLLFNFFFK